MRKIGRSLLLEPGEVELLGEAARAQAAASPGPQTRAVMLRAIGDELLSFIREPRPPVYVLQPTNPQTARAYAAWLAGQRR